MAEGETRLEALKRENREYARDADEMRELLDDAHANNRKLRAELAETKTAFLRCALAAGVAHEADGVAPAPGPIEAVERAIREGASAIGQVIELKLARASVWREGFHAAENAIGLNHCGVDLCPYEHPDAAELQADADAQLAEDIREHDAERVQGLAPRATDNPRSQADYEVRPRRGR